MRINLIAVGERMPDWVEQGFKTYAQRLRGQCRLELTEITAIKRGKNADIPRIMQREEQKIRSVIKSNGHIVALDRRGKAWSTRQLAEKIKGWQQFSPDVDLLVGGPEGLSNSILDDADEIWSLSSLTFAHPLVRVLVAEQVYRAWSILEGLPYHR